MTVDTACSSSLVSLHMAFNTLLLGQCDAAVGAGVNLILHPETMAIAQKAGMLTPDGRCKTLSTAADGYGRAEACGLLMIEAEIDRNSKERGASGPLALVAGSAVNQDGRSSSLTAPNGPSQQSVVRSALGAAHLEAQQVTALQMHGTGTALGDPIEVGAVAASIVKAGRVAPLTLMAAKSWIGHAEPAAGIVGLAHAQAAMVQSAQLPLLHLANPNSYVTTVMGRQHAGWAIPRQPAAMALPVASARSVVGISAFAFQGTNAHVLLAGVGDSLCAPLRSSPVWQKQLHWVAPPAHRCVEQLCVGPCAWP